MPTEIAILNIRVADSALPQPGLNVGYVTFDLAGDDFARMIGDGWRPLSHQMMATSDQELMISVLCIRTERQESIDPGIP